MWFIHPHFSGLPHWHWHNRCLSHYWYWVEWAISNQNESYQRVNYVHGFNDECVLYKVRFPHHWLSVWGSHRCRALVDSSHRVNAELLFAIGMLIMVMAEKNGLNKIIFAKIYSTCLLKIIRWLLAFFIVKLKLGVWLIHMMPQVAKLSSRGHATYAAYVIRYFTNHITLLLHVCSNT